MEQAEEARIRAIEEAPDPELEALDKAIIAMTDEPEQLAA
jgi:hypothetical protein